MSYLRFGTTCALLPGTVSFMQVLGPKAGDRGLNWTIGPLDRKEYRSTVGFGVGPVISLWVTPEKNWLINKNDENRQVLEVKPINQISDIYQDHPFEVFLKDL